MSETVVPTWMTTVAYVVTLRAYEAGRPAEYTVGVYRTFADAIRAVEVHAELIDCGLSTGVVPIQDDIPGYHSKSWVVPVVYFPGEYWIEEFAVDACPIIFRFPIVKWFTLPAPLADLRGRTQVRWRASVVQPQVEDQAATARAATVTSRCDSTRTSRRCRARMDDGVGV